MEVQITAETAKQMRATGGFSIKTWFSRAASGSQLSTLMFLSDKLEILRDAVIALLSFGSNEFQLSERTGCRARVQGLRDAFTASWAHFAGGIGRATKLQDRVALRGCYSKGWTAICCSVRRH